MISYVDSSVLLRIVLGEAEQLGEWESLQPVSSALLRVECLRAIERYRLMPAFDDATAAERRTAVLEHAKALRLVDISAAVLERAADPFPVYVATLDAIHLATAIELRIEMGDLAFATHDTRLAAAARALDFAVIGAEV